MNIRTWAIQIKTPTYTLWAGFGVKSWTYTILTFEPTTWHRPYLDHHLTFV